jgi:geranylgeranyl pyrophosphate synthase
MSVQVIDYREKYFSLMKEFTAKVQPQIQNYLNIYCFDNRVMPCLSFFFDKRIKTPCLMRPFLVKLAYEVMGGKNTDEILPVAAIAEFINISSYQANSALDGKYGIFTKLEKDNQVIASMITLEMVEKILCNIDCTTVIKDRIRRLYYEANRYMYYGQFYELNTLNWRNLNFNKLTLDEYLEIYIQKCDYLGGTFFENVAISGAVLATDDEIQIEYLGNCARNFGIGLGIINDMSDYLPSKYPYVFPSYKTSVDQYSDVKNGKIFLPVFYALKYGNFEQREHVIKILTSGNTLEEELIVLTSILHSTGAFRFAFLLAQKYLKLAKKSLHKLEKNMSRDLLSVMLSSIRTNKYMYYLREINV